MNLKSSCYPLDLLIANIALACIDGALASIAFSQVLPCFSSSFLCIPLYFVSFLMALEFAIWDW